MTAKHRSTPAAAICDPPLANWPDDGVYQLWLWVSVTIRVRVGRLGVFRFPAGTYVYTGRAARGLRARVRRHIRGARYQHWHIDYLLARREVRLERVTLAAADARDECAVNQATRGTVVVPGFGASDCRQRCRAHLRRVTDRRNNRRRTRRSGAKGRPCSPAAGRIRPAAT